jgi:hypothetical protein
VQGELIQQLMNTGVKIMTDHTTVAIAGGGPAGMVLGLLLARAGVEVTVLEKHADFLRDFRGDTVHASTVRLMDELGLGEKFRALPQSRLGNFELTDAKGQPVLLGDFGTLPAPYDYVAMLPQWDLLNILAAEAGREPSFPLRQNTAATRLIASYLRLLRGSSPGAAKFLRSTRRGALTFCLTTRIAPPENVGHALFGTGMNELHRGERSGTTRRCGRRNDWN